MAKSESADEISSEKLKELPPSAKLVYKVLEYNGNLTQQELAERTYLPGRTVRYATKRLQEVDIVAQTRNLQDARQHTYSIIDGKESDRTVSAHE